MNTFNKKANNAESAERKKIEEMHRKDIKASKSKDFKTLLSLWDENGVLLEPGKPPIIGKNAIKAYMDEQSKSSQTYTIKKYEHLWKEIKIIGDWAFEWGFFYGEAEIIASHEIIKQKGKIFRVLKKQKDSSWKAAKVIYHNDPIS